MAEALGVVAEYLSTPHQLALFASFDVSESTVVCRGVLKIDHVAVLFPVSEHVSPPQLAATQPGPVLKGLLPLQVAGCHPSGRKAT